MKDNYTDGQHYQSEKLHKLLTRDDHSQTAPSHCSGPRHIGGHERPLIKEPLRGQTSALQALGPQRHLHSLEAGGISCGSMGQMHTGLLGSPQLAEQAIVLQVGLHKPRGTSLLPNLSSTHIVLMLLTQGPNSTLQPCMV